MVQVTCRSCGSELTKPCAWGLVDIYDLKCGMGAPSVPQGVLISLTAKEAAPVLRNNVVVGTTAYSPAGIAANPADVSEYALTSAGTDNGCCGSDGCDGPNRACACGSIVATQWSDCWTQAEVRFLPDAVSLSG